jgi:tetratricopeptide (TPR) repeat protein
LHDQPLQRARLLGTLGALYCKLGLPEDCRKYLEEALALESADTQTQVDPLLLAQHRVWLAQAYAGQNRWSDGEKLLRTAIPVLAARLAPADSLLITAQRYLGDVLRRQQKTTESIAVLEKLRATLRTPQGKDSLDAADVNGALANTYLEAGRSDEALQLQQERLRTTRALAGPDDVRYMAALANWGAMNTTLGHPDVAERALREAVAGYQRLVGDDADVTIAAQNGLMVALQSQGKNQEALEWARRIVASHRNRGGTDTPSFASNLDNLGETLEQLGYYSEALPRLREAYAILQRHYGEGNVHTHIARLNIAHVLILMHQPQEALALLNAEIPLSLEGYSASTERTRRLVLLGDGYADMGRFDEARRYYDQTQAMVKADFKPDSVFAAFATGYIDWGRARLLLQEEHYQEALPRLRDLLERFRRAGPSNINYQATVLRLQMELAQTLLALHQTAEAAALVKANRDAIHKLAPTHPAYQKLQWLQAKLGQS